MSQEPVRIRCAADLFSVLSSGPMPAQLAVLRDIIADPLRPLGLGRHEGEDLVDLLLRLIPLTSGPVKQAQTICLMSFDDPRVTNFLAVEFANSRDSATVLHLGKRLSLNLNLDFFRPFLWSKNSAQALAAARHCSQEGVELSPKERLRVALVLDQDFEPPALSESTLDVWLEALAGPDRARVRRLVEQSGDGILVFWNRYSSLAPAELDWLAESTAGLDPDLLRARMPELLATPAVSAAIAEQALRLGVELPAGLLQSTQERVRATAIACGLADAGLDDYLAPGVSPVEAVAAAGRCSVEKLLDLLSDKRWQVRAAATDRLSQESLDDLPLEKLRAKTGSSHAGEKVAAVELLHRLGETWWLEENLAPAVGSNS